MVLEKVGKVQGKPLESPEILSGRQRGNYLSGYPCIAVCTLTDCAPTYPVVLNDVEEKVWIKGGHGDS